MPNQLATETSPYLRQHADNPVEWHPWGETALALARANDKPILLSIGYSACHWCHVMAHESFEHAPTAQVMNELFVNIKLDREERPDLDRTFQLAHQALSRRGGGWPLTVFLMPDDLVPFYAGTYFPREARHGLPGFVEVLRAVRKGYDEQREALRAQNRSLVAFIAELSNPEGGDTRALTHEPVAAALTQLARTFDQQWGGFGRAPKFPHTGDLELLLAVGTTVTPGVAESEAHEAAEACRQMLETTLDRMAAGGIHDQLGGGFARYSVDAEWAIPHFEKMLYDNALLLPLYARAAQAFAREDFAAVARRIGEWARREMRAPEGGLYAALDADSEGHEGKFYVWQRTEVEALLDADERDVALPHFGFDRPPNFEGEAWNPLLATDAQQVSERLGVSRDTVDARIAAASAKLFSAREKRIRPGTDDKRLTAWNAMYAAGAARASRALADVELARQAREVLAFLRAHAWRDGRLFASWKDGRARFPAYLDDHAWLIDALLESLRVRFDPELLAWAIELAEALLARFADRERGGFYFTADDAEHVITRAKTFADESYPSGNGVAARAIGRLGHLLGEARYLDAVERTLAAAWPTLTQMPQACATTIAALREHLSPPMQVVIRARLGESALPEDWTNALRELARGDVEVYVIPADASGLPGVLAARNASQVTPLAYACRGTECLAPIGEAAALLEALGVPYST